jgi:phage replication O-like protein O
MASPQCENGYCKIANELMEALARTRIRGEETQVLLAILRKTYGFNKKSDTIPISQLQLLTGMDRSSVCRAIRGLTSKKIISSDKCATRTPSKYSLNKDYDRWSVSDNRATTSDIIATSPSDTIATKLVTKLPPSKDNTKDKRKTHNGAIPFLEIISYLNDQSGKNFRAGTDANKNFIEARWNEGFRVNDFKTVVSIKCSQWKSDPHWSKFLRPSTLFGTKFDSYLNEQPKKSGSSLLDNANEMFDIPGEE